MSSSSLSASNDSKLMERMEQMMTERMKILEERLAKEAKEKERALTKVMDENGMLLKMLKYMEKNEE